MQQGYVVQLW